MVLSAACSERNRRGEHLYLSERVSVHTCARGPFSEMHYSGSNYTVEEGKTSGSDLQMLGGKPGIDVAQICRSAGLLRTYLAA